MLSIASNILQRERDAQGLQSSSQPAETQEALFKSLMKPRYGRLEEGRQAQVDEKVATMRVQTATTTKNYEELKTFTTKKKKDSAIIYSHNSAYSHLKNAEIMPLF
ncbi:hypothetical protein BTUL_0021g00760 [Botrytis tulipae]|uniref:Uncharacterized protein n=1 Tax=Botrytis tulipae TaxID=87230 RepID=A0A4Z1F758_9HELO|nr:hypothetical protein BTUL_0021g00760 [Botrytis tulipae]